MTEASLTRSRAGAIAVGANALGALAVGAFAIGTLAIARLAIRRLAIRQTRLASVEISTNGGASMRYLVCLLVIASAVFASEQQAAQPKNSAQKMKRVPVNGGALEYEIRGDGEPVLLIHGSHIASSFLPLMTERALAGYRLIRYHRRGLAGSTGHAGHFSIERQAADAAALLQYLGVARAHVVGHSYGGVTALQLAFDAPDLVRSLTLLEPALTRVSSGAAFAEETLASAIERYRAGDRVGAVEIFMQKVAGTDWRGKIARTVPGGPEQAEQDAATFFEVEIPALQQWEFDSLKAKKISQPVLYVLGSESLTMFKEGKDLIHKWIPQTEDHLVPGADHSLQMEDSRAVAEGIASFLSRHPLGVRKTF